MAQQTLNTPREVTHQRIADALEDIVDKIVDTSSAFNVDYDNTQSGLSANKVQGAVDELASEKADKSTTLAGYGITDAYTKAEVYTQSEVNNIVSTLETNIDWKEAVNTYADIATTYPNPQDGWTVNVKDTDYTYRYNGSEWVAISANAIPEATTSVKGLMTPTQVSKLNGIEAGAQVNTVTSVAGKTGAVTLTKSDVGLGNVDNTADLDKPISTATQNALNLKANTSDISTSLTATGNPLTIESSESNLVECVAEVEAVQEGSGDPSPTNIRPITGQTEVVIDDVGKNLWDEGLLEIGGISGDSHNKGNTTTWMRGTKAIFLSSGTYNLSSLNFIGRISNVYEWSAEVIRGDNFVRKIIEHVLPCSFTLAESAYISFEISVGRTVTLDDLTNSNVQLELGSTATEYEPYKGKTYRVEIGQKNKFNKDDSSSIIDGFINAGAISASTSAKTIFVKCKPDTQYTVSKTAGARFSVGYTTTQPQAGTTVSGTITNHTASDITIKTGTDAQYLVAFVYNSSYDTITAEQMLATVQVEQGSQATPYVPYNPNLPDAIYGGELDVVTGELRVTHGYIESYNGESLPSTWISDRDEYSEGATPTIGAQVVYELATPYTIQLTPQQIKLLKGTNHLSCNVKELSIKYYPDNVLGQLKGDIESEYDDRIETLETQMVERPQLKRYSTRLLCDGFSSKNISITTDKKIIPLFARFDAEYMELYVDYEPRFYNPLVFYDDGTAYIEYQTSGIPNDNQQRTFEMYYYEV